MTDRKRMKAWRGKRIGVILASIHTGAALQLWPPLVRRAERSGVELFIFPGGRLQAADSEESIRNRIFELADSHNLDGIITWSSSLGGYVGIPDVDAFHERWADLPLVSMTHRLPGRPCVRISASEGMFPLLDHLYSEHQVRRFAFIRGPLEHDAADDRWQAFREFLASRGLTLDERCVSSPLPWGNGEQAIAEFLDQRGLMPGRDFQALLASSDMQLYPALLELSRRGFSIPSDLLVAGFNDSPESRIMSPTLTTVRMPFADQADQALVALLSLLAGESVPDETVLQSSLVVRRSCGCASPSVSLAGQEPNRRDAAAPAALYAERNQKARLLEAVSACFGATVAERSAWMQPLVDAFWESLEPHSASPQSPFIVTLERIADRFILMGTELEPLQQVLSTFRLEARRRLGASELIRAEDLVDKARVTLAEASNRASSYARWKTGQIATVIRQLEMDLIRLESRTELCTVLARHLPSLDISSAYLIEVCAEGKERLVAGFEDGTPLTRERLGPQAKNTLLPAPTQGGRSWIVQPLFGKGISYGRILLRVGISDGAIYEELGAAVSSAIQGLRAIDEIKRAREAAIRADALKNHFLASVSAELQQPLQLIIGNVGKMEESLQAESREKGRKRLLQERLQELRQEARRQLRLTDDLLDLARSETGDLMPDLRLTHPSTILDLFREESMAEQTAIMMDDGLPLVLADAPRLVRLFSSLLEHSSAASLHCLARRACVVFELRTVSRSTSPADDSLGRGPSLARRIAAAHSGRLEELREGDASCGWLIKLPLPTFKGAGSLDWPAGPDLDIGDLRTPIENGSVVAWSPGARFEAEAAAIFDWVRNPVAAAIPLRILAPAESLVSGYLGSVADFLRSRSETGAQAPICILDGDEERRRELVRALARRTGVQVVERDGADGDAGRGASLVVVRLEQIPTQASAPRQDPDYRARVVICPQLSSREPIEPLLNAQRTILVNEGVLEADELAELILALRNGRAILPPYTGAMVKSAIAWLNMNLSGPVSRWQLAEAVHVSEDYLTRIFSKELGLSPWEYLTRLRLHEARRLLAETTDSVRVIAVRCGFQDQAYFCRVFGKMYGKSPSAWRSSQSR